MKLEDIFSIWKIDSKIDDTDLTNEAGKTPELHAKYYELYSNENLIYQKLEHDLNKLYKLKSEYYFGKLSTQELKENGWEPFELKILRQDIDTYMKADQDLIDMMLKIALQKEKVDTLKDIIKQIHTRNFAIKNMIDYLKFSSGF